MNDAQWTYVCRPSHGRGDGADLIPPRKSKPGTGCMYRHPETRLRHDMMRARKSLHDPNVMKVSESCLFANVDVFRSFSMDIPNLDAFILNQIH